MDFATHFIGRRADAITRRVNAAEFVTQSNVHMVVAPSLRVPLPLPTVAGRRPEDVVIQIPNGMPPKPPGFLRECISPEMTVSRISGVTCLPGGVALLGPDVVLDETFSAYWEKQYHHHMTRVGDNLYALKAVPETEAVALMGRYLLLDYQHLEHFGHFILDVLPRVWAYHHCTEVLGMRDLRVLVTGPVHNAYVYDLLDAAGVPRRDVVVIDRPTVCEEVLIPTKALQLQEYTSPLAGATWRRIIEALDGRTETGGRIYLSRSRTPQRPLVNEAEVEQVFAEHGFEIVHPQEHAHAAMVSKMAGAELVAGPSGTNLCNIAFGRAIRGVMVLASPLLVHYTDQFLAQPNLTPLHYVIGTLDAAMPGYDPNFVHSPWIVDAGQVRAEVAAWVNRWGS